MDITQELTRLAPCDLLVSPMTNNHSPPLKMDEALSAAIALEAAGNIDDAVLICNALLDMQPGCNGTTLREIGDKYH